MSCWVLKVIRTVYVVFVVGVSASSALAATENVTSFAAIEAFQAQSSTPISIDGALVVHDLRNWTQSWDYQLRMAARTAEQYRDRAKYDSGDASFLPRFY